MNHNALFMLAIISVQTARSLTDAPNGYENPIPKEEEPKAVLESKPKLAVQGVVACQNCKWLGSHSLLGSKPIEGATVGVSCRDEKDNGGQFYAVGKTNWMGYFYLVVDGFDPDECNAEEFCTVYLVSSPDKNCDEFTNINAGIVGSPVRLAHTVVRKHKTVVHSSGPFAFAPSDCVAPAPPLPAIHY